MSDHLQQELILLVAHELNMDPVKINPDVPLIGYSLDSFSLFNLKYIIEQKYKITLLQNSPIEEVTINKIVNKVTQL